MNADTLADVPPSSGRAVTLRFTAPSTIRSGRDAGLTRPRWQVLGEGHEWGRLEDDWNRLAEPGTPLADATWARRFLDAFASPVRSSRIHALYEGERLVAVLPVERVGRFARAWVSLDNEHCPYWTFPAAAPSLELAGAILDHLLRDADYIFLRRFEKASAMCRFLVEAANRKHLTTCLLQAEHGDARIPLVRPWSAFRASLSDNIVTDTPRKLRKLSKLGRLEHEVIADRGALEAALGECLAVEARGWKGVSGEPIRSRPETYRFYSRMAHDLHARARFELWVLRLDGRIIAFEYWLRGGGHIEMLKLSFDPAYARQSPGNVLRYLALKREVEEGDATVYHLGQSSAWKSRWATAVEPLCTLRIYAPTLRGHAAYLAGPALRGALKGGEIARAARWALAFRGARKSHEKT